MRPMGPSGWVGLFKVQKIKKLVPKAGLASGTQSGKVGGWEAETRSRKHERKT